MTSLTNFAEYIEEKAESLAVDVVESVVKKAALSLPEWERNEAVHMYHDMWQFLGETIKIEEEDAIPSTLLDWSKKNAEMQVSAGKEILEIIVRYPPTREVFNEIVTKISKELKLTVEENSYILKRIGRLLDVSLNETIYSFKRMSDKQQEEVQKDLIKLSAPIVPVEDDVVIIPVVGDITPAVVQHMMDSVIPKVAEMEVNYVIVDYSGTLTIDTQIAESLHQLGNMMRVMGIKVLLAGFRPDMVWNMMDSNIDMTAMASHATVKQALEYLRK
ncbi:STAS domain-containing protein [Virgibacillus xinjiangensis]|uniref:STAS domain-containing protein n=1 Tax=Virgibacillus xinjiangensis TaxID=393090 RepID=A0ABV7CWD3_9BACI